MPSSAKYTLLTGATGLIGRYLLRDLLSAGENVCVLVRHGKKESAAQRIEQILQMWEAQSGKSLPRPYVVTGEVTQAGLGVSSEARSWIAAHCSSVLHNAAILEFYGSDRQGEPWLTNLTGTENLLQFCRDTKLRKMHYVSTAYVSGDRAGTILEDEFACGQGFRNDYEESKYFAEKAVRDAGFDVLTVYRPAVVAGDSKTGYTSTYHGLYLYLRLIAMMMTTKEPDSDGVRRFRARWNCTGQEFRNIIPVDWVAAAMARIFLTPAAHGGNYHLAPRNPITLQQLVDYIGSYYNSEGIEFLGNQEKLSPEQMSEMEREGYAAISIYESYLTTDPRFDTRNTDRFTADMPCPDIDEEILHRFIRYGEEDRWGKRRAKPIKRAPVSPPSDLTGLRSMVGGNS